MRHFLRTTLLCFVLVIFFLFSGCDILEYLLGDITITDPEDGAVVGTSSVTIYVETTYNYVDYITVEVNYTEVYTSSYGDFEYTVSLDPGWNIIEVTCYAFQNAEDTESSYMGSDSIDVYYDDVEPTLTIDSPANWSIQSTADVTISGTISDNYGIYSLEYLEDGIYKPVTDIIGENWSLELTGLSESTHSYAFKAEDYAGWAVMGFITFTVNIE